MGATMKITLDAALALQEQKRRRQEREERQRRERQKNSPAEKAKREQRRIDSDESMRLFLASREAEQADDDEPPLYQVILEHFDIRDPKFSKLRARLVITLKHIVAEREYSATYRFNRNDPGQGVARELARAKEILTMLESIVEGSAVNPAQGGRDA
jgi:hypothetical protein